jgi:hypothetical protein
MTLGFKILIYRLHKLNLYWKVTGSASVEEVERYFVDFILPFSTKEEERNDSSTYFRDGIILYWLLFLTVVGLEEIKAFLNEDTPSVDWRFAFRAFWDLQRAHPSQAYVLNHFFLFERQHFNDSTARQTPVAKPKEQAKKQVSSRSLKTRMSEEKVEESSWDIQKVTPTKTGKS